MDRMTGDGMSADKLLNGWLWLPGGRQTGRGPGALGSSPLS